MESHSTDRAERTKSATASRLLQNNKMQKIALAVGAILLVLLSAFIVLSLFGTEKPRSDLYQAVFLDSNNQVFFGKLKNVNGPYLTLENAYYSQKQELPKNATDQQKAATANNLSLVKVADTVYGPENTMVIKTEHVLFWQNLSKDSKVTKAIESKQQSTTTAPTPVQ